MAAALFEPTTDSFGNLTVHAVPRTRAGLVDWARWASATETDAESRGRNNLFVGMAFLTVFVTAIASLYVVDQVVYQAGSPQASAGYTSSVDYD